MAAPWLLFLGSPSLESKACAGQSALAKHNPENGKKGLPRTLFTGDIETRLNMENIKPVAILQ